jgi:adenylate cyclase
MLSKIDYKNKGTFRPQFDRRKMMKTISILDSVIPIPSMVKQTNDVYLFAFDFFLKMRSPQPQDDRIVIVGMGEEDVEKIGTALISDEIYAKLLEKLLNYQPIAIGLDVYRDVPIPPGTDELKKI